jgi:hypothetical protein
MLAYAQPMPIRPEPGFLESFDALESNIRALPQLEPLLPEPAPPDPEVLEEWLAPHRGWDLPQVYLDYLARYGGATTNVPPNIIGLRPLVTLLGARQRQLARGSDYRTRRIVLTPGNGIDGTYCLVFSDEWIEPRVATMFDDDIIEFVADSFAMHLWSWCFLFGAVYECRFRETLYVPVATEDLDRFHRSLASELERIGFALLGADSRTICAQRGGTIVCTFMRGPKVGLAMGNRGSIRAVTEAKVDLEGLLHGV